MKGDVKMKSKLSALSALAFFHPLVAFAQTQEPTGPWNWPGPWHMWGWGFWWVFPLIMVFMIIACIAMLLFGHRAGGGLTHWGPRSLGGPTYSALQILNERFAKGEISKEEYEERRAAMMTMLSV
jgi:putative membrane protein